MVPRVTVLVVISVGLLAVVDTSLVVLKLVKPLVEGIVADVVGLVVSAVVVLELMDELGVAISVDVIEVVSGLVG